MSNTLEVVRFRVAAAQATRFAEERASADAALRQFPGFLGSDLAQIDTEQWLLIVRWTSHADMQAAQQVTLSPSSPSALTAWIALAAEVVNFEAAELRHSSLAERIG